MLLYAFLCGLSLTNHLTSGLLIPAGFVLLVERGNLARASQALVQGRIYLLSPDPEMLNYFENRGYRPAQIGGTRLYRVIPYG